MRHKRDKCFMGYREFETLGPASTAVRVDNLNQIRFRPSDPGQWQKLKALALDSVTSPHTRRAYETALNSFLAWYHAESRPAISKPVLNTYKAQLGAAGLSASTINVPLSALRKLVS